MVKTKSILAYSLLAIVVAVALFAIFAADDSLNQPFTVRDELQVWQPSYYTAECVTGESFTEEIESHSDGGEWYHCTSEESGSYIPEDKIPPSQCTYSISDEYVTTVYVCEGFTEDNDDLSTEICEKERGIFSSATGQQDFTVNAGDSVYINTFKAFGDAELRVEYPNYKLRIRQADGFVDYDTSCEISQIPSELELEEEAGTLTISPNEPFNVVGRLELARGSQVAQLEDVASGQLVYISRAGHYYLIEETADGTLYVDTAGGEFEDSDIECVPRSTGCSDEAKLTTLSGQSCGATSGTPIGYQVIENDITRMCLYSCIDGEVTQTSTCVDVPTECPSDKPLWSADKGCHAAATSDIDFDLGDNLFLIIGIFVMLIAIVVGIGQARKKGGKK